MQNEPNYKDRILNSEYRRQNKKMCISVYPIEDCAAIIPTNCLSRYQVVISGHYETKPIRLRFQLRRDKSGYNLKLFEINIL